MFGKSDWLDILGMCQTESFCFFEVYTTLENKDYSLSVLCEQAFQTNAGLLDKGANNSKIPAPSVISQHSLVFNDVNAPNYTCN